MTKRFDFLLKQSELFSHFVDAGHSAKDFKKGGAALVEATTTPRKVHIADLTHYSSLHAAVAHRHEHMHLTPSTLTLPA